MGGKGGGNVLGEHVVNMIWWVWSYGFVCFGRFDLIPSRMALAVGSLIS